jgi:hypothetical protein
LKAIGARYLSRQHNTYSQQFIYFDPFSFSQIITSVTVSRLVLNLRILRADMHDNNAPLAWNQGRNQIYASGDTIQKKSFFDPIITSLAEESSSRHGVDHIEYSQ